METVVAVVAVAAVLFLVARGLPGRNLLVAAACALAAIVLVVALEQNGWWPAAWRTR